MQENLFGGELLDSVASVGQEEETLNSEEEVDTETAATVEITANEVDEALNSEE